MYTFRKHKQYIHEHMKVLLFDLYYPTILIEHTSSFEELSRGLFSGVMLIDSGEEAFVCSLLPMEP